MNDDEPTGGTHRSLHDDLADVLRGGGGMAEVGRARARGFTVPGLIADLAQLRSPIGNDGPRTLWRPPAMSAANEHRRDLADRAAQVERQRRRRITEKTKRAKRAKRRAQRKARRRNR